MTKVLITTVPFGDKNKYPLELLDQANVEYLFNRYLLTAHMGSMSEDCRTKMEIEATNEAIRFLSRKPLKNMVPKEECIVQQDDLL